MSNPIKKSIDNINFEVDLLRNNPSAFTHIIVENVNLKNQIEDLKKSYNSLYLDNSILRANLTTLKKENNILLEKVKALEQVKTEVKTENLKRKERD